MHGVLISPDEVDDFIILRARAFTSSIFRSMPRRILRDEDVALLEWQLMFAIARLGSCHLAYITQHTSIDPAHGSRAAAALEKRGYIARREDPENRRRKLISLTSKGRETVARIWPQARATMKRVTNQLSAQDFQELKRLLDKINTAAAQLEADIVEGDEPHDADMEDFRTTAHA